MCADFLDKEPDFINSEGIKWWLDKNLTNYARKLKNTSVWIIEKPDKFRTRLLLIDNEIVYENQTLEGMACKIDAIAFSNKF